MVISWPKGIKARGEVRQQYHHATDVAATVLDVAGLRCRVYGGVKRYPLNGCRCAASFDDPKAPTTRKRQYYAMLGTRGIWEDGWKAAALRPDQRAAGPFPRRQVGLYHVGEDRSESTNLADQQPGKLQGNSSRPGTGGQEQFRAALDDRSATEVLTSPRPKAEPPRDRPSITRTPRRCLERGGQHPRPLQESRQCRAEQRRRRGDLRPRLPAGGHTLFIKDGQLHYVYNFLGVKPRNGTSSRRRCRRASTPSAWVQARQGR